jgi:hypothetical protein
MNYKGKIDGLLDGTGVEINGPNDFDPQVFNPDFYRNVVRH